MISCCSAGFAIAAVQACRELAIPRRVLVEVGIEQKKAHAADAHAPHGGEHRAIAERHGGDRRLAVARDRGLDRRVGPVQPLVVFLLPAVDRDALVEIALRVHEADADQRHAEVARFLAVVAGEHAEAAGVDRQRLVQRELGGEVRDDLAVERRAVLRPPRAFRRAGFVEAGDRRGRRARETPDPAPPPADARRRWSSTSAPGCATTAARAGNRAGGTPGAPSGSSSTTGRARARGGDECELGRSSGRSVPIVPLSDR